MHYCKPEVPQSKGGKRIKSLFPSKPTRQSPLCLSRLFLNRAIKLINLLVHLVNPSTDFIRCLVTQLVNLVLAILSDLGDALVDLGLGAGIVDLPSTHQHLQSFDSSPRG
jgi:hypothetical protein